MASILACLGGLLASAPTHLKPGALTHHLGDVSLIEEVLTVRYPFTSLLNTSATVQIVSQKLLGLADTIRATKSRENKAPSGFHSQTTLQLLWDRVLFLQAKVDKANRNYASHPIHSRKRRGLLNLVGSAANFFFGTATEDEVQDLRDHYNKLLDSAARNQRVVSLNCKKIALLHSHLEKLLNHTNQLASLTNSALQELEEVRNLFLVDQSIQVLSSVLDAVLVTNSDIVANMVDAVRGRVTPSLLPLEDLETILDIGSRNYSFEPLYTIERSQFYYPLLDASLTKSDIAVHIPFKSRDSFHAYEVVPFPFLAGNSTLSLDLTPSLVLISKDYAVYASTALTELGSCRSSFVRTYHCSASLFAFLPVSGGVCELALTHQLASNALSLCPYKQLPSPSVFHKNFHGFHYFYFGRPLYISVVCPESTVYLEVSGHYAVAEACHVRSSNITTYPSRVHLAFTANVSHSVFPIQSLANLKVSNITYVTNSLGVLTFNDESEFADTVAETLPEYLYPIALYPSVLVPIVALAVGLGIVCCCLKRVSSVHAHLVEELELEERQRKRSRK